MYGEITGLSCSKIERNNCMGASLVFTYGDKAKRTVAFNSSKGRDGIYFQLKDILAGDNNKLDFKNADFVNDHHKARLIEIMENQKWQPKDVELLNIDTE